MDKENEDQNEAKGKSESYVSFSVSQQTDAFIKQFNKSKNDMEINLLKVGQLENSEKIPADLNHINEDFQKLQRYVSDSTMYLPMYNIRAAQEALKHLQDNIYTTEEKVLPKKKFAFKKKKILSASKDLIDGAKSIHQRKNLDIDLYECGFKNMQNENLEKNSEVSGKDVSLHKLVDCTIRITAYANTVHISQLRNCRIFLGPVSTSVFVEDCQECLLVVACQQLRVHSTKGCDIYLQVTSKAIIEDCSDLRFAPYNLKYDGIENHFKLSNLDPLRNNWNDIDDFNWLAKDVPSPNWSIMGVEKRIESFE